MTNLSNLKLSNLMINISVHSEQNGAFFLVKSLFLRENASNAFLSKYEVAEIFSTFTIILNDSSVLFEINFRLSICSKIM